VVDLEGTEQVWRSAQLALSHRVFAIKYTTRRQIISPKNTAATPSGAVGWPSNGRRPNTERIYGWLAAVTTAGYRLTPDRLASLLTAGNCTTRRERRQSANIVARRGVVVCCRPRGRSGRRASNNSRRGA